MKKATEHHLIYENKRQPILYFVSIIVIALAVFIFYMIFSDWKEFASEYSSRFSAIAWTAFMLVAGNAMLLCIIWLNGRYVLQIEKSTENHILIKTWSISGFHKTRKYPESMLENPIFNFGNASFSHVPTVKASWWKLKAPNGKSFVVDLQGEFFYSFKESNRLKKNKL